MQANSAIDDACKWVCFGALLIPCAAFALRLAWEILTGRWK